MSLKRNIIANLLGRSYAMASVYLFVPFYVATLGIERYGVIAFYAILLTIAGLADAGLSATLSREAAREGDRAKLRDLLATIERVLLASTLVFAAIVILAADVIARRWLNADAGTSSSEVAMSLRLMALMIPPQIGISVYTAGLLGLERHATANAIQAALVTVRGGLVIPLMYLQASLPLFFGWQLAATLAFFVTARTLMLGGLGFGPWTLGNASLATLRPVLGFAGGMFAITLLAAINTQMDKLVVSKIFAMAEFSYYSLASTLAQLPAAIVTPLLVAMLPRLTRMISESDEVGASALFARFSRLVAALSGMGAFGLIAFTPEILALWLGAGHVVPAVIDVARILSLGGLFLALGATPFYLGLAHGHNRTSIVVGFATLALAMPALIIASTRFGLAGAAWPWVLINLSSLVALTLVVVRRYYLASRRQLLTHSLLGPLMTAACALGIARLIANALAASPLFACGIAGALGVTALAVTLRDDLRILGGRRRRLTVG